MDNEFKKTCFEQRFVDKIDDLNASLDVRWVWVRAHQTDDSDDTFYNNMADELATGAIIK